MIDTYQIRKSYPKTYKDKVTMKLSKHCVLFIFPHLFLFKVIKADDAELSIEKSVLLLITMFKNNYL